MKFVINPTVCLVCFVHDLANWHISCIPTFAKHWSIWSIYPKTLSRQEKRTLKQLASLFRKYLKENDELWIRKLWSDTYRPTIPQAQKLLFQVFSPRFEYFYHQQIANMKQLQSYLEKFQQKYLSELQATRQFYNFKKKIQATAYLTLSFQANKQAGGILIDIGKDNKYRILLKFGDFKLGEDNWPLENTYLHEMGHIYQCSDQFESLVNKYSNKILLPNQFKHLGIKSKDVLTEVIHASLWGQTGYFSQKVYGTKILPVNPDKAYHSQIEAAARQLNNLIGSYLKRRQSLDTNFIKTAIEKWNAQVQK